MLLRVVPTGASLPPAPNRSQSALVDPAGARKFVHTLVRARTHSDVHSPAASFSGSATTSATEAEPTSDGVLGFDRLGVTCASSVSVPWLEEESIRRATGLLPRRLRLRGRGGVGSFSPQDAQCSARANCCATSTVVACVSPRPSRRKSKQHQRHSRESSSSALSLAIISGIAAKPTSDQQRQCMCACSNQLERHCRWPFMTTSAMPLRWPTKPPCFYDQFAQSGRRQVNARSAELPAASTSPGTG